MLAMNYSTRGQRRKSPEEMGTFNRPLLVYEIAKIGQVSHICKSEVHPRAFLGSACPQDDRCNPMDRGGVQMSAFSKC